MAQADASAFPVLNQPFRLSVAFRDASSNLITGWTGATSIVSSDGATSGAGATPIEIGATGMGYLDLTAAQMNSPFIMVKCSISNTGAAPFVAAIYTVDTTDTPGNRSNRLDRMLAYCFRRWFNARDEKPSNSANQSTVTIYRDAPNNGLPFTTFAVSDSGTATSSTQAT